MRSDIGWKALMLSYTMDRLNDLPGEVREWNRKTPMEHEDFLSEWALVRDAWGQLSGYGGVPSELNDLLSVRSVDMTKLGVAL